MLFFGFLHRTNFVEFFCSDVILWLFDYVLDLKTIVIAKITQLFLQDVQSKFTVSELWQTTFAWQVRFLVSVPKSRYCVFGIAHFFLDFTRLAKTSVIHHRHLFQHFFIIFGSRPDIGKLKDIPLQVFRGSSVTFVRSKEGCGPVEESLVYGY